jgi:hypothetical protein
MSLWPVQVDQKSFGPATTFYRTIALSFVIPSEAEGSAVLRTIRGNVLRPERTRISYHAELATSTYAPFRRERRMKMASANKFDRKSGGA